MNREQIENTIRALAKSQGFYSRMLESMEKMKVESPDMYDAVMVELEEQNFKDQVDLVMFFER